MMASPKNTLKSERPSGGEASNLLRLGRLIGACMMGTRALARVSARRPKPRCRQRGGGPGACRPHRGHFLEGRGQFAE